MKKFSTATDIILHSMLSDPTRAGDVSEILKFRDSPTERAEAIRSYCGHALSNCLAVEQEVVKNLIEKTSWDELVCQLDTLLPLVSAANQIERPRT